MKTKVFDLQRYQFEQVVIALTCPVNRDSTRRRHSCDDFELFKNPKLLIENFIEKGGAEAFAKRRAEFEREIEIPDQVEPEYFI